jgi:Ca-activated chloride channel homolog
MKMALNGLYPNDTFNLITFAGDTHVLFDKPVSATKANLEKAQAFLDGQRGGGGTEMMKAIKASLAPSDSQSHLRIVCFMTDGYVGNEGEILSEIKKHQNARVFSFGIGSSVNRFLLDKMAEEGRGEVQYVTLQDDGTKAAKNFHERIRNPLLTDISIDWNGLEVADVYPKRQADLFSAKPLVIYGRYTKPGSGTIKLKGKFAGAEIIREIPVNFAENATGNDVLATLWARTRIDDLMSNDYNSVAQNGKTKPEIEQTITQLGLEYRLMTQFTSFVAVEEKIVNQNGKPVRVDVPVELPEGVSDKAVSGETVDVTSAQTTVTITSSQIQTLPITTRNMQSLITLTPGTADSTKKKVRKVKNETGSGMGGGRGDGSGVAVSGQRSSSNQITIDGVESDEPPKTMSKEEKEVKDKELKLRKINSKLHSWVYDLVERLSKNTSTPTANEAYFVKDGKAEISITLNDKSSVAIIEKLKKLGFEVTSENQTIVSGKISIDKISALAEIEEVKFILPNVK